MEMFNQNPPSSVKSISERGLRCHRRGVYRWKKPEFRHSMHSIRKPILSAGNGLLQTGGSVITAEHRLMVGN
jgi:hypothetical protein